MRAILPLLFVLSGCAAHRVEITQRAQGELLGLTRQALLDCMGKPQSQEQQGSQETLVYTGTDPDHGCPLMPLAAGKPPRHCEALFVLEGGKVKAVSYRAQNGSAIEDLGQCAFLVKKCVK